MNASPEKYFQDFRVLSPPVLQNATENSFAVAWAVSGNAIGQVEWGTTKDLGHRVTPSRNGLVAQSDYVLSARIENIPDGGSVYYRVITQPLFYETPERITVGPPIPGEIRKFHLPQANASTCHLAVINDTHAHENTVDHLADNIEKSNPDLLVWNGDTANYVASPREMAQTILSPGQTGNGPASGGWASTRPLVFIPGNHDVRGHALSLSEALLPWPMQDGNPSGLASAPGTRGRYCFTQRIGPVAIIGLDTGEDKPDWRFGPTAAYEPYREAQREWLAKALQQPEITSAPYLLTICHIPLHGLPGQNDGTGPEGFAFYSGFGQQLWVPLLREAGCQAVISGHVHVHRIDPPSLDFPMHQIVGGGPAEPDATLIHIRADNRVLDLTVENLDGKTINRLRLMPRKSLNTNIK